MEPEREIRKLLEEFLIRRDNLIVSEKIFVAVSVLNWAYLNYKDKDILRNYLEQVKSHLKGDIELYWQNGVVKIKRGKR